jgi:Rieske Fe-S protein
MSDTTTPPETPLTLRRRLLQWSAIGLGGLASAALGIPLVGYVLGAVIKRQPDEWINLGPISQFPENQTRLKNFPLPKAQSWDGWTGQTSAYVRRLPHNKFLVLAVNCAHLGCPVEWFAPAGLFMCPCHGGVYYEDGSLASGPPPRGLFRYDYEVRSGNLFIKGGHLPTMHDTLRDDDKEGKA